MKFAVSKGDNVNFSEDTYVFSLHPKKKSTIFSSLYDLWRRISTSQIPPIYEDLFVLGLSVFAIDKRMKRSISDDNWSRNIEVSLPVSDEVLWSNSKETIEQMLAFLSGDSWNVSFYHSDDRFSMKPIRRNRAIDFNGYEGVCLFSGGLDSFCGAVDLVEQGNSLCLLGHNEYPKLRKTQENMADAIQRSYPPTRIGFYNFSANAHAPVNVNGALEGGENTCRSRSILFLCAAVSIAGFISSDAPVYIPENGFISINVPLTQSRSGSCSTRTTHPFFIGCFQQLLEDIELRHSIINPFEFLSKREVVQKVSKTPVFEEIYRETISCSHPCIPRWKGLEYPKNCGYCYPCIIRKSSLLDEKQGNIGYSDLPFNSLSELVGYHHDSANDLKAILASVHRYCSLSDSDIIRLIASTGPITSENYEKHLRVYKASMNDLLILLERDYGYKEV